MSSFRKKTLLAPRLKNREQFPDDTCLVKLHLSLQKVPFLSLPNQLSRPCLEWQGFCQIDMVMSACYILWNKVRSSLIMSGKLRCYGGLRFFQPEFLHHILPTFQAIEKSRSYRFILFCYWLTVCAIETIIIFSSVTLFSLPSSRVNSANQVMGRRVQRWKKQLGQKLQ